MSTQRAGKRVRNAGTIGGGDMNWKKALQRISIGIAALLILAVIGVVIYVRTDAFHRFVAREIFEQVKKKPERASRSATSPFTEAIWARTSTDQATWH